MVLCLLTASRHGSVSVNGEKFEPVKILTAILGGESGLFFFNDMFDQAGPMMTISYRTEQASVYICDTYNCIIQY